MTVFSFSSVITTIIRKMHKYTYGSNEKLLMGLFRDAVTGYISPAEASKWIHGERGLPAYIVEYYGDAESLPELEKTVRTEIRARLADPYPVVMELDALVMAASNLSEYKKNELTSDRPWMTDDEIVAFLTRVLRTAILLPFQRQEEAEKALQERRGISPVLAEHCSRKPPSPVGWFQGREEEMEQLFQRLQGGNKIFLYGIPGIGKSELAKYFAKQYRKEFVNIIYLNYAGSLRKMIAGLYVATDRLDATEQERFEAHNHLLGGLKADSLLIVDNFDAANDTEELDDFLDTMLNYDCSILFTTRNRYEDQDEMELAELADPDLQKLVAHFYKNAAKKQETVQQIIETVHGHTLAVELAARLLKNSRLKPETLLKKLRRKAADPDDDEVRIHKDGKRPNATYYAHIHTLFALSRLSPRSKGLLRHMILMPDRGVPAAVFGSWLGLKNLNAVNRLVELGYIRPGDDDEIALHPMMRDVAIEEMPPSVSNSQELIENLRRICEEDGRDFDGYWYLIETIENIVTTVRVDAPPAYLRFLEDAFFYLDKYSHRSGQMLILGQMTALLEDASLGTAKDRALLLHCRAFCAEIIREAIDLELQALELLQPVAPDTVRLAANIHNYTGTLYRGLFDYESAVFHMKRGMELLEQYAMDFSYDDIVNFANCAACLVDLGRAGDGIAIVEALNRKLIAHGLENSLYQAFLMETLGGFYVVDRQQETAAEHYNWALEIYRSVYADQPELVEQKAQQLRLEYVQGTLKMGMEPYGLLP